MIKNNIVKINICFPSLSSDQGNKEAMVNEMMGLIPYNKEIGYAGLAKEKDLRNLVSGWIHKKNIEAYKQSTQDEREDIEAVIKSVVLKCLESNPIPSLNVFVFPRVHTFNVYDKIMGYVTGYTPHSSVIHIYMSTMGYSIDSLKSTVAHEFNHAVYFNHRNSRSQTIRDAIIFEGLAENFEEYLLGTQPPVSKTLNKKEAKKALIKMTPELDTRVSWGEGSAYRNIFLGGGGYEKWTGYSVGYFIIKSFREAYSNISWEDIMKIDTENIFTKSPFVEGIKKGDAGE